MGGFDQTSRQRWTCVILINTHVVIIIKPINGKNWKGTALINYWKNRRRFSRMLSTDIQLSTLLSTPSSLLSNEHTRAPITLSLAGHARKCCVLIVAIIDEMLLNCFARFYAEMHSKYCAIETVISLG